ncbi:unnamed protein product [Zymoseptoria tritici ST99CH_3D7]|uniref:Uncharacterized protein n=1 Tax=Zymoseptoria tritici (strain ST99CH_3D7) TaxID=1276538 RepID=A0A1X7S381_ZYMT9|nr:unnamed protein product [Zymoseptoria tritici ST99CH_3D7]
MPSLLDLPDELLSVILSHPPPPDSTLPSCLLPRSFSDHELLVASFSFYQSLAQTCKRMLFVAQPLLYQSLALNSLRIDEWDDRSMDHYPDTHLLARTMCESPHLRTLVRKINIPKCAALETGRYFEDTPIEDGFRQVLRPILSGYGDFFDLLMYGLDQRCGAADAVVVMLLSPNLEKVTLNWSGTRQCYHNARLGSDCQMAIVGEALRILSTTQVPGQIAPRPLLTLKHMSVDGWQENRHSRHLADHVSPDILTNIMQLPGLRSVEARYLEPKNFYPDIMQTLEPGSSDVRSLKLSNMSLAAPWLKNIVRSCRGLKTFSYEAQKDDCTIDLDAVRDALVGQENTLRTLCITNFTGGQQKWTTRSSLGSLTSFVYLTRLEVEESVLVGQHGDMRAWSVVDMLPPTIKTLVLHTSRAASRLTAIVTNLAPLQSNALDRLIISCPLYRVEYGQSNDLNNSYARLLYRSEPLVFSDIVSVRVVRVLWSDHMTVTFSGLQDVGCADLTDLADGLAGGRLKALIREQMLKTWDREVALGEALLSVYDGKTAPGREVVEPEAEVDFGDALSSLFELVETGPEAYLNGSLADLEHGKNADE